MGSRFNQNPVIETDTIALTNGWTRADFTTIEGEGDLTFIPGDVVSIEYGDLPVIPFSAIGEDGMVDTQAVDMFGYFANIDPYLGGRPLFIAIKDEIWKKVGDRT